jgi:hypothetical protein
MVGRLKAHAAVYFRSDNTYSVRVAALVANTTPHGLSLSTFWHFGASAGALFVFKQGRRLHTRRQLGLFGSASLRSTGPAPKMAIIAGSSAPSFTPGQARRTKPPAGTGTQLFGSKSRPLFTHHVPDAQPIIDLWRTGAVRSYNPDTISSAKYSPACSSHQKALPPNRFVAAAAPLGPFVMAEGS